MEKKSYEVRCFYRTDNGMAYGHPTSVDYVRVDASTENEACRAAIAAMYDKHGEKCSHVRPDLVTEIN